MGVKLQHFGSRGLGSFLQVPCWKRFSFKLDAELAGEVLLLKCKLDACSASSRLLQAGVIQVLLTSVVEWQLQSWNDSEIIPHFCNPGMEWEWKWNGGITGRNVIGMELGAFCPEWSGNGIWARFLCELCRSSAKAHGLLAQCYRTVKVALETA